MIVAEVAVQKWVVAHKKVVVHKLVVARMRVVAHTSVVSRNFVFPFQKYQIQLFIANDL